jgi:hypothetical protein
VGNRAGNKKSTLLCCDTAIKVDSIDFSHKPES